jgi:hypothetical protein
MTILYNYIKRGLNKLPTRRFVPREYQESGFVLNNILPNSGDKWTPNYEGPCVMTVTTLDGGKLTHHRNTDAVKQYFVKNMSSISRKPEKAA